MNFFFECETISSRKNKRIVDAAGLSEKKLRTKSGLFCADGEKLLCEILDSGIKVQSVFFTEKAALTSGELLERAAKNGARMFCVTDEVMDKLTEEKAPQGIFTCAVMKEHEAVSKELLEKSDKGWLVLDSIQNPGNLGTILRTALCLGLEKIILCGACADIYSPKTLRGAMGAVFRGDILLCSDVCEAIQLLTQSGKRVYAAALTDKALCAGSIDFLPSDSIVIGNEGHGLAQKAIELCTSAVIIPMQSGMDSLNAGIAAAILIWEKTKKVSVK